VVIIVVFKGVSGPDGVKVMYLKGPDPITRIIDEITNSVIKIMTVKCIMEYIRKESPKIWN
jgi:hypothetical protein